MDKKKIAIIIVAIIVVIFIGSKLFGKKQSSDEETRKDNLLVTETNFDKTAKIEGFEISKIKFVNGESSSLFIAKVKNLEAIKKEARFNVTAYDKQNKVINTFLIDCGEIEANAEYSLSADVEGFLKDVDRLEYTYEMKK